MEQGQPDAPYNPESPDKTSSDLFNGKLPLVDALNKLRTRLLDLSARNRLLNYRHPKRRSIQFVDEPDLDLVFTRLIDGRPIPTKYVPDPPTESYTTKRPDAKSFAQSVGIETNAEFSPKILGSKTNKHTPRLQTLYYPADLDKLCRRLTSDARTIIEETGTNMLYLIFGFLEFYEREDSEKPMLAPLLAVPVTLEKGSIDNETRTYQYLIAYSGEDVHENQTLREKLSQEFSLQLPDFEEEDEPSVYFAKIQQAVQRKKNWKVKCQLTLGFLSFGKLAIWHDLDTKKWPGLLKHPLLKDIFTGSSGGGASFFSSDYEIDQHPQSDLPLIFDADSSQHSAIIDVLSGRNMVINGPPGTGKSQTITNVIAAGLRAGKKILFVSEKLAALEVVRHRLNQANLGHFCLELHSHKTQKKKLIVELQERLDQRFRSPQHLNEKVSALKRHKKDLNRYAELMASRFGNEIGLTIHDVFWRTERLRQVIRESANTVQSFFFSDASEWSYDDVEIRRAKLDVLAQLYSAIGTFDSTHPWWGLTPRPLAPGDDESIRRIIFEARSLSESLADLVSSYRQKTDCDDEPSLDDLGVLCEALQSLPPPPDALIEDMLPRIVTSDVRSGERNVQLLRDFIQDIEQARNFKGKADSILLSGCDLDLEKVESILTVFMNDLNAHALSIPLHDLEEHVIQTNKYLQQFEQLLSRATYTFGLIDTSTLDILETRIRETTPLNLLGKSIGDIKNGASLLSQESARLSASLERVTRIARRRDIDFDGSPAAINHLTRPDGIDSILPDVLVDDDVIRETRRAAEYLHADFPIADLNNFQDELRTVSDRIRRALDEITGHAQHLGFQFDDSPRAVKELAALARIAAQAPVDLLDYRRQSMAQARAIEVLALAEEAHRSENSQREQLAQDVYLDTLPAEKDLLTAISVFRRGDSVFNIFNREWRATKKLFNDFSRKKTKRNAADYETQLIKIISWIRHRASFVENSEFKETFGLLFRGLETDFSKIRRLCNWYAGSYAEMLRYPGFIESVDLSTMDARRILQLGNLSHRFQEISDELDSSAVQVTRLLGINSVRLELNQQVSGWREYGQAVLRIADELKTFAIFLGRYVTQQVSPKRAVELLEAKREIQTVSGDLEALKHGTEAIQISVESFLPGIISVPCTRWSDYLVEVSGLISSARALAEWAEEYGGNELSVADIRTFHECKIALTTSAETFAILRDEEAASEWPSYAAMVKRRACAAAELVHLLKPWAKPDASVRTVVDGLVANRQATDLISGIRKDIALMDLLQGAFRGFETDLSSLAATLSWSESVIGNIPIRCSPLYPLLLASEARLNLSWAKNTLQTIVGVQEKLKTTLNQLDEFGSLSWDEWNSYGPDESKDTLASHLLKRIQTAADHIDSVLPWSKYHAQRLNCENSGLGDFVHALEQKQLPATLCGKAFEFTTYRSIGKSIYKSFPELAGFSGAEHEKTRAEYARLDEEIISLTGRSFAYEIDKAKVMPDGNTGYKASERTETQLLSHELGKQRRHLPIRQLIKRAGRAILALKPCFMMGPMSVAQYLEQGSVAFDIVVMDEASQLRPEEALGAVARGKQLVVVGDPKQLPPTNFFDRMLDGGDEDDDETPAAIAGSESILDICQQLFHPIRTLRWHYRSQHESLIAFSNHHFYKRQLLIFPSPYERNNRLGVRYHYIRDGVYKDRQNIQEALCVVDAVIDHMMTRPEESIGVVTLNLTQRDLIEDLLDKKLRNIEEGQAFISRWQEQGWPFFVKNLENVQGDERDVIFISTTFGKAPDTDRVRQNFGPISRPDGWRRLNVLFTRARRRIGLFTSMLPEDILLEANTPAGTRALKDYLDFAKRGVLTDTNISDREPDSDFEISVSEILQNRGYEVVPQLGVAGFFIDLAVRNPNRPGEFMAAIECDGAAYHSSSSARDRDRIRETILESLGWKNRIWRIWSTDWFYNPRRESERLFAFLEQRQEIGASESAPDLDSNSDFKDIGETQEFTSADTSKITVTPGLPNSEEELYVEVGDSVTYCYVDRPDDRLNATIVDGESNPKLNLTNENSPVAQALLNCAIGDEPELRVTGSAPRVLRVLKIQRQQNLWTVGVETDPVVEKNATMPGPPPSIGARTSTYPFGYGYCQCGCRQFTKMVNTDDVWVWARYIEGHQTL